MAARKVDIVFCFDASESMRPHVDAIRRHVSALTDWLRKSNFSWRIDFVAHHICGRTKAGMVYCDRSVFGDTVDLLYDAEEAHFFTKDIMEFKSALSTISFAGDENMLYALDLALDFPFGSVEDTQRVVVLLSDEAFETNEPSCLEKAREVFPKICQKVQDHHVTLFAAMPISRGDMAEKLAKVDRADFVALAKDANGNVQFNASNWLHQLGRTISSSVISRTSIVEHDDRALFGQDTWSDFADEDVESIGDIK